MDWPIFVLTLEGDEARRAPLLKELESQNLHYELIMGIDGRSGLPSEYEGQVNRAAAMDLLGRPMTDGELACALSHRAAYKRVLEEGLPGAIILEDDAILKPSFGSSVHVGDHKKAPMVLFDYAYGRAIRFRRRRTSQGYLHRAAVQCTMACAYSVSKAAARKLFDATTPVKNVADWPCSLYDLEAWLMVPRLVTHQPPGTPRESHLDAQRELLKNIHPENVSLPPLSMGAKLRRKLSVRVGRARGER